MQIVDYIVVGSGCAGANAAQTLVDNNCQVLMLDGGMTDNIYQHKIPDLDFLSIKKTERHQYEYFIGENLEGIPFGKINTGEHLTPPRKFMIEQVSRWLPLVSDTFFPLESLALGGLGNGWGLGCCMFSDNELKATGLNVAEMKDAYEEVGSRIGISGTVDDTADYTSGRLKDLMPSIEMDSIGKNLLQNYSKRKQSLNKQGFYMGRPSLALLTQDKGNRKKYPYKDLDFYCDKDRSAYRPGFTIEYLQNKGNFTYRAGLVVLRFEENADHTVVECRTIDTNETIFFHCRKLILAAGCLGTARIVLRSFQAWGQKLPVISNPYSYLPALQPYLLGKDTDQYKIGFAQLSMFHDPNGNQMDVAMGSVYSYRSMMAFHILKETPLGIKAGYSFLQYMMPAFAIIGLFHPEQAGPHKHLTMLPDPSSVTGDKMHVQYVLNESENLRVAKTEKLFASAFARLNCFVLKKINPGNGAGIHYAGTLPFSNSNERFRILPTGLLGETRSVYIADGSGINYLPGKGLTFSLMANAHVVAKQAMKNV